MTMEPKFDKYCREHTLLQTLLWTGTSVIVVDREISHPPISKTLGDNSGGVTLNAPTSSIPA